MNTRRSRVLVLGAGSIGARHARELVALGADVDVADPEPARAAAVIGATPVPFGLGAELAGYDGIVVASPTRFHVEQALAALESGAKVLVEKPLALSVAEARPLVPWSASVMVGYNLRFHSPSRQLRELTADGTVGTVRAARFWFGSYLPDWRPGIDYRQSYSARADLGGGILLDAIHELDLVVWWFGTAVAVTASMVARVGELDIDVEDTVKALLRTGDGVPVEVSLDYLSRRYRRGVELIGEDATLRFDWARQEIEIDRSSGTVVIQDKTAVAQSYVLQSACFLEWLRGEGPAGVGGTEALASLRLADEIRALAT